MTVGRKYRTIPDILTWDELKNVSNYIRKRCIEQFIFIYSRWANRDGDSFKWGDEVEYLLVKFDDENKVARLSLSSEELLKILHQREDESPNDLDTLWSAEVGGFMLESAPAKPFDHELSSLNLVEADMKQRRHEIAKLLAEDECLMTLTSFPRLGAPNFTWPIYEPQPLNKDSFGQSMYFPDEAVFQKIPGNRVWTRNIREKRGEKVKITPRIFRDENTQIPVDGAPVDKPDAVHMDSTYLGFSCCALQVTFQASNLAEARTIYDQLGALAPIMLALTAAAPAFRGYLVDSDSRWNVASQSADCRTPEERGEAPLKENQMRIPKSKYSSIESYLSADSEKYNDNPLTYDEKLYQRLREGGVDHLMAQHVAQLCNCDTTVMYRNKLFSDESDEIEEYHYTNTVLANWRSVRLKHPISNPDCGWRIEFRPCEVQLTDFDNAAIACFMTLLTRVIISQKLNFLTPMSKVDENFETAQKRNACHTGRFWFRKNVFSDQMRDVNGNELSEDGIKLMTMNEIFNGNGSTFPGLIALIIKYLSKMDVDTKTYQIIQRYLQLIQGRTSGELLTTASWIRQEITNHPEYKQDSVVSDRINYDLMKKVKEIQEGTRPCPELYGSINKTEIYDNFLENRYRGN